MKLGKVEISGVPNWPFWIITLVALYAAFTEASWLPVLLWMGFVALALAIGLFGMWLESDWRAPRLGP